MPLLVLLIHAEALLLLVATIGSGEEGASGIASWWWPFEAERI